MTEPVTTAPNRLPIILGAGAVALLALFAGTQLLGGGDDDDETTTTTTVPLDQVQPPAATPTTIVAPPAETFEVFSTKNPFLALRTIGGATGATGATGGTVTRTPTGTATSGTAGTTGTGTTGTGTTATGGTSGSRATTSSGAGGANEPLRATRVALLDVFAEGGRTVATVRVGDTVHKVTEGQVFATSFKAVSLSQGDRCGRFLFGDDAFRLCKGEESLK